MTPAPPATPAATPAPGTGPLARRLGVRDAVVIGLGSMVGAGVFAVWAPAAAAAGSWLLGALLLALVVATCNATSTAQLAAATPTSGGTYAFGREHLGHWWGFAAGWCFVIGKTASCAAMALTFAAYALPGGLGAHPLVRGAVAAAAVAILTAVSVRGITRTARAATVLLAIVLAALALVVAVAWLGPGPGTESDPGAANIHGNFPGGVAGGSDIGGRTTSATGAGSLFGVLQAAGLLIFAFAGYARVATLGEEVREPRRTIPRAVLTSLVLAALLYAVLAVTLLARLGTERLAVSTAPLRDVVLAASSDAAAGPAVAVAVVAVSVGAAAACLGAVLSVLAGISRTALAMARERDIPAPLARVDPLHQVPRNAQLAVAVVVVVAVLAVDLRGAVGFSSFGVLLYYAVANLAALRQRGADRLYPRPAQVLGVALCVVLAFSLPAGSVVAGVAVLAAGLVGRAVVLTRRGR